MPSSGTLRRRYRTLRSSACSANVAFAHERSGQRNRRTAKMISTGRQQRNRTLSLPLALRQLEAAGNLGNLRLAIVGKREGYRGPVFMDADIYKTPGGGRLGELGRGGDQELAAFDEETTALLEKAQQPDGYLNSAVQVHGQPRYSNLAHSHEMHCAGHLIQAGVACLRAAGLDRLLGVARRFADHLVNTFLGQLGGLDGHPIVERQWWSCTGRPGTGRTWSWPASGSSSAGTG